MKKIIGNHISPLTLTDIYEQPVNLIPQTGKFTHIQFRRFAGCPVCNLHLQSFFEQASALENAGIQEVIFFHASKENMLANTVKTSFHLIADLEKTYYKQFGLESSWKALLHPSVLTSATQGLFANGFAKPEKLETELVVPADFLINEQGEIIALKYGKHANDQWSVNEVLTLAKTL